MYRRAEHLARRALARMLESPVAQTLVGVCAGTTCIAFVTKTNSAFVSWQKLREMRILCGDHSSFFAEPPAGEALPVEKGPEIPCNPDPTDVCPCACAC